MKYFLLSLCIISFAIIVRGQSGISGNEVIITSKKGKTSIITNENGELQLNVSPKVVKKLNNKGFIQYSDFGAKGDGKSDDMDNIAATHAFANQQGLPVKADDGYIYYISGKERTAIIRTSTDFGTAKFIIDDTEVENRNASIFVINSGLKSYNLKGITSLKKNQLKIDASFNGPHLVTVTDSNTRRYIRYGPNQNDGSSQTDIFVVDQNGYVDMNAPIIWDFDQITAIKVLPINEDRLTISGGHFTTIANKAPSKYTYYDRNILIQRSNVVIDGLEHHITGETENGAPYGGFLRIQDCSYVMVKNTVLTGHKTYRTVGSAGDSVSMGSYDILVNRALNVSFINCSQTNDINDRTYWGIMGSNYSKNLLFDGCIFSRFDAHMGVANATIRNSTLGHMGINAIGTGTLTVENSTIRGTTLVNLRSDYGSTWEGDFIIRNCIFIPRANRHNNVSLIGGYNSGQHDFGYTCYMPKKITIESLEIDDSNFPDDYDGPTLFKNFNPELNDDTYREKFPYVVSDEVTLQNISTTSGKKLRVSDNMYMFRNIEINTQ